MGFFGKVAAAGKGRAIIELAEIAYSKCPALCPYMEPYQFMVSYWEACFQEAGKELLAISGKEILKVYGCLPSPLCVRMMAHHICCYLLPEFSKTHLMNEWERTMQEVVELKAACDADRLNALFEANNPETFKLFLAEHGEPPFDKEKMRQSEERMLRLGFG
jgi:hypothetical protein